MASSEDEDSQEMASFVVDDEEMLSLSGSDSEEEVFEDSETTSSSDAENEEDVASAKHGKSRDGPSWKPTTQNRSVKKARGPSNLETLLEAVKQSSAPETSGASTQMMEQPKMLQSVQLHSHQTEGLAWLAAGWDRGVSGILADEMGLGKTLQALSLFCHLLETNKGRSPFLVIAPLSTIGVWVGEIKRFVPTLRALAYVGDQDARAPIRQEVVQHVVAHNDKNQRKDPANLPFDVLVTNYEIAIRDVKFLSRFRWRVAVVDEAHRLKNHKSLLYRVLIREYSVFHWVLLTGTPIQNNLEELWSLLRFCAPRIFTNHEMFVRWFGLKKRALADAAAAADPSMVSVLHAVIRPFILRRTKRQVAHALSKITEFVLFTGLSAMQTEYYRAIIKREAVGVFEGPSATAKRVHGLQNILMQLRKCCLHPYLFEGAEPEPFVEGDHLVKNSGKLTLLDRLLPRLRQEGHRVLLFSQMVRMLDIVQDFLQYRGFSYERLDGSVRGEERNMAVQRFAADGSAFVFLLSTRAGGLGLNLVAADTVIFLDSDFNPQADLQAMARAHRYGQTRDVRVFRLVSEHTVEEAILLRALGKLQLQHSVVERAGLAPQGEDNVGEGTANLEDIIRFGLRHIVDSSQNSVPSADDADAILNRAQELTLLSSSAGQEVESLHVADRETPSVNGGGGEWFGLESNETRSGVSGPADVESKPEQNRPKSQVQVERLAVNEPKNLETNLSNQPSSVLEERVHADAASLEKLLAEVRAARSSAVGAASTDQIGEAGKLALRRRVLDVDEEAMEREKAEKKRRRLEAADERKKAMWAKAGYHSLVIDDDVAEYTAARKSPPLPEDEEKDVGLRFVVGDATVPQSQAQQRAIIVNAVDASGDWGRGGFFAALDNRFGDVPRDVYENAGRMRDLEEGTVHLAPIPVQQGSREVYVCHVIAMKRLRKPSQGRSVMELNMEYLTTALKKVAAAARRLGASVHSPRLGRRGTAEWYSAERIYRRHVVAKGVTVFVYYYNPALIAQRQGIGAASAPHMGKPSSDDRRRRRGGSGECLDGVRVFFHRVAGEELKRLQQQVQTLGGTVTDEARRATHLVTSLNGWDSAMVAATLANPSIHCVRSGWISACGKAPAGQSVDSSSYVVRTGTVFKGARVAVHCSGSDVTRQVKTDVITYGGTVCEGTGDAECQVIVTDYDLGNPVVRAAVEASVSTTAVTPAWVESSIETGRALCEPGELRRFAIPPPSSGRAMDPDSFYPVPK